MNGNPSPFLDILWIIGIVFAMAYLSGVWARRHNGIFNLKWMIAGGITGFIEHLIFKANGFNGPPAWGIIIFSVFVVYKARPSQSNRRIPADVRRRVIANWQRKSGEKFNSREYELDHVVPFSRGGGHTLDNLRVIEKRKNRSKGARVPWWDVIGQINNVIFRR